MQLIRFLSRVAFICNICFLAAAFTQWIPRMPQLPDNGLTSTIIMMGYFLSIIINILVNTNVIILFLFGRLRAAGIRTWLLIANLTVFVIQVILLIINYHPQ
jgi:hypothetical protein